jgi:type IV secretory pathway VirB10-like protein
LPVDNSGVLNPGDSPNGLVNVRRLNHVPLYVLGVVAALVAGIIAFVAFDKSKPAPANPGDHGGNTDSYAQQAAGSGHGYIPAYRPTPWPAMTPVVVATPMPTPDDTETKARTAAFYQALGSPTAIADQPASAPTTVQEMQPPVQPAMPYPDIGQLGPQPSATLNPNALSTYDGTKDRWTSSGRVEKPPSKYILQTGWTIPALLLSGMESQLPGMIIGQVASDVYDSPSGRYLVIPKGSRLVGEYSSAISFGQSRIFVAWQRIIFPNGNTLDMGAQEGADGSGEAGFHDATNNHFLTIFGSALLMSAFTAGITLSQPQNSGYNGSQSASGALSQALGQQLGTATSQLLERNLSVPPTLKIRQGYRFNVVVVKDLIFNSEYHVPNY